MLFDWNLSRSPIIGQVLNLDLLCTGFNLEHADIFGCLIFTQSPMNYRKIEPRIECGFGWL